MGHDDSLFGVVFYFGVIKFDSSCGWLAVGPACLFVLNQAENYNVKRKKIPKTRFAHQFCRLSGTPQGKTWWYAPRFHTNPDLGNNVSKIYIKRGIQRRR